MFIYPEPVERIAGRLNLGESTTPQQRSSMNNDPTNVMFSFVFVEPVERIAG